jgi:hypothetical protein
MAGPSSTHTFDEVTFRKAIGGNMSLSNTIAHDGVPSARRTSVTASVVTTALALAVATVGIAIFQRVTHETPGAAIAVQSQLTGEEFVQLNTTDLPRLVDSEVLAPALAGEEFVRLNTTSLPELGVVGSAGSASEGLAVEEFVRLNTISLPELGVVGSAGSASEGLAVEEFVRLNTTSLPQASDPEYAEPASGPR